MNGRALPTWARAYTVGPQKYMRIGPGGSGNSTSARWRVLESRIDPPERLGAIDLGEDAPELGAALGAGQRAPQGAQVAADRLQLADQLPCLRLVEALGGALTQLTEA